MGAGANKQYQSEKTRHAAAVLEAVRNYESAHPSKFSEDYFPQAFKKRVLLAATEAKCAGKDIDASLAQLTDADIETLWKYVEEQRQQQLEESKQAAEENAAMEVEEFVEDEALGGQENANDNIDETTSVLSYGEGDGDNENENEEENNDFSEVEEVESPRSSLLLGKGSSKSNKQRECSNDEILEDLEQTTDAIPPLKRMDSHHAMRGSAVKIFPMESASSTPRRRLISNEEAKEAKNSSLTLSEPTNNIADALAKFWEIDEIGSIASQLSLGLDSPRTGNNSNPTPFSPNVNRSSGGANVLGDERLMGLQRQKVMSYTQNAQLEREVEALQRQLERMEALDSNNSGNVGSPSLHRSMQSSSSTVHSGSKPVTNSTNTAQAKYYSHNIHMPMKLSYIYPIDEEANEWPINASSSRSPIPPSAVADSKLAARQQKAAYYSHHGSNSSNGNGKKVMNSNGGKDNKKLLSSSSSDDEHQPIIHHHHHVSNQGNNSKAVVQRGTAAKEDTKSTQNGVAITANDKAASNNSNNANSSAANRYSNSNHKNGKYYNQQRNSNNAINGDSGLDSDDSASVTSTSKYANSNVRKGGAIGGAASDSDSQQPQPQPLSARRNVNKRIPVIKDNNKEKRDKESKGSAADHSPPPAGYSPSNAATAITNLLASSKQVSKHSNHSHGQHEARRAARNTITSDNDHKPSPTAHHNSQAAAAAAAALAGNISEDEQHSLDRASNKNNALKRANKRRHSADGLLVVSQLPDEAQLQLLMEKQISHLELMSPGGKNRIKQVDHQQGLKTGAADSNNNKQPPVAGKQHRQRLSNASNDSQQQQQAAQQERKERQSSGMLSDHDFDALFAADSPSRFPTHASTLQQTAHNNGGHTSFTGTDSSMEIAAHTDNISSIPLPTMTLEDASPSLAHHTLQQQQQQQQAPQLQQPSQAGTTVNVPPKRKVRVKSVAAGAGASSKAAAASAATAAASVTASNGHGGDETSVTVKEEAWTRDLDNLWGEVSLLLRKPIRCEEDMLYAVAAAEAGIIFTDQMNTIAKQLNVLRGALSRWLLPYDNNTRIETQCSTPHSVVENMPLDFRGKLTERQVHYLVAGANEVRKLVRVKIADDNDLDQAREALKTADMFFKKLYIRATQMSMQPFDLLQSSGAMA